KRKNLTTSEKRGMIHDLLRGSKNGVLQRGDFKRVGALYQQHPETVSRHWRLYQQKKEA
ncbi:unnamed protein product, partial [Pylaiella littoralis]